MLCLLNVFLVHWDAKSIRLPLIPPNKQPYVCELQFEDPNIEISIPNSTLASIYDITRTDSYTIAHLNITAYSDVPDYTNISLKNSTGNEKVFKIKFSSINHISTKLSSPYLYLNQSIEFLQINVSDYSKKQFAYIPFEWINITSDNNALSLSQTIYPNITLPVNSYFLTANSIGKIYFSVKILDISSKSIKTNIYQSMFLPQTEIFISESLPSSISICSTNLSTMKCMTKVDPSYFNITNSNNSVIEYSLKNKEIKIKPLSIGRATIKIFFSSLSHNFLAADITVTKPDIVVSKDQYIIIGNNPNFELFDVYDIDRNKIEHPYNQIIVGNFTNTVEGTQIIDSSIFGVNFTFTVHFVNKAVIKPDSARLPVKQSGFKFEINFGSGNFSYSSDNVNIASINEDGYITANQIGETNINVFDLNTNSKSSALVIVEDILSARFNMTRFEMNVGEQINISFFALAMSGQVFTHFVPDAIISLNESVINRTFCCVNPGFVRIQMSCGDSNSTELYSVIEPLKTVEKITGFCDNVFDLQISGGPQHWEDAEPPNYYVFCGNDEGIRIYDSKINFSDTYRGNCTLKVYNDATENNPVPLVHESVFEVNVVRIAKVAIVITDETAQIQTSDCGVVRPLAYSEPQEFLRYWRVSIPYFKIPTFRLFFFDENETVVDIDNTTSIHGVLSSGKRIQTPLLSPLNEVANFKYKKGNLSASITLKPLFNLSISEELVLMKNMPVPEAVITGGSGKYNITKLSKNSIRVDDICVPEFSSMIDVIFSKPYRIEVNGPKRCAVGYSIDLFVSIFDDKGRKFHDSVLNFANITIANQSVINGTFKFSPTKPGVYKLEARIGEITKIHEVMVFEKLTMSSSSEIVTFPGRFVSISFSNGPVDLVKYKSMDSDIITDDLFAVLPGKTTVRAYIDGAENFSFIDISIIVTNVTDVIIKSSSDIFVTGSMTVFSAFAVTEKGDIPVYDVKWKADFPIRVNGGKAYAKFIKEGSFTINVRFYGFVHSFSLEVEERIVAETMISLPIGTSHYIESNGFCIPDIFEANEIGVFNAECRKGKQSQNVSIIVSKPAEAFIEQDGDLLYVKLIDSQGEYYSSFNGTTTKINATFDEVDGGFRVYNQTVVDIEISNNYFSFNAIVQIHDSYIHLPEYLLLGESGQLTCTDLVDWKSSSKSLFVSMTGKFVAKKAGFATVQCSQHNKANTSVTKLLGAEVYPNDDEYIEVRPIFSHGRRNKMDRLFDFIDCSCGTENCMRINDRYICPISDNLNVSMSKNVGDNRKYLPILWK